MKIKSCDDENQSISISFDAGRVYQEQLNFREILITEEISDNLIEKAVIPIINFNRYDDECEAKIKDYVREPIKILIHTSGGLLDSCMSLISTIKASKTPVHTIALGKAYSAGFLILIAGHQRYAQEHSNLMVHPGSGGYQGSFPSIIKHASQVIETQNRLNQYINENTSIEMSDLEEMCEHEYDWYMYPPEALLRGIIDGIIVGDKIINQEMLLEAQEKQEKTEKKKNAPKRKAATKKTYQEN